MFVVHIDVPDMAISSGSTEKSEDGIDTAARKWFRASVVRDLPPQIMFRDFTCADCSIQSISNFLKDDKSRTTYEGEVDGLLRRIDLLRVFA